MDDVSPEEVVNPRILAVWTLGGWAIGFAFAAWYQSIGILGMHVRVLSLYDRQPLPRQPPSLF